MSPVSSNTKPPLPKPKSTHAGLLSSSTIISAMTLLSRVLGLVRDVMIAHILGAGSSADAFLVAFKVPNFLRRLFAEGAFAQAFVPVLSEYMGQGKDSIRGLLAPVMGILGVITGFICLAAMIFSEQVTWLFAPGFADDPVKMMLTAKMTQITFPYLFFVSMMACASGVLNSYRIFAPSAFAPVLLNLCMIGALVIFAPLLEVPSMALAWSVTVAGFLQLFLHLVFLKRIHLLVLPSLQWRHSGVRKILLLMAPAIFGVSVSQINLLLDTVLASFLIDGSVSWLYYADRLVELPLGIFGIAIATVILPHLSSQHVGASLKSFQGTLDWGLRWVILLGIPAAMALIVLAEPILTTLFYYGEFKRLDVAQSAAALRAYSLALLPFMLIKVLATGYFSRQDTKTPVKIGILAMVVNMIANLSLVWTFQHVGLALATALSATLNASLLYFGLSKQGVYKLSRATKLFFAKIMLASLGMICVIALFDLSLNFWTSAVLWERFMWLLGIGILSIGVFFCLLVALGVRLAHLHEPNG